MAHSTLHSSAHRPIANDRLNVTGAVNLISGSPLSVNLTGGYNPGIGDPFDLPDWTTSLNLNGFAYGTGLRIGGAADNLNYNLQLPGLSAGCYWDLSQFSNYGVIVVVPEPGRTVWVVIGCAALLLRRRRIPG